MNLLDYNSFRSETPFPSISILRYQFNLISSHSKLNSILIPEYSHLNIALNYKILHILFRLTRVHSSCHDADNGDSDDNQTELQRKEFAEPHLKTQKKNSRHRIDTQPSEMIRSPESHMHNVPHSFASRGRHKHWWPVALVSLS